MRAYADLRNIESSTEAMIQVCLLITFTMVHEFWEDFHGMGPFEYMRHLGKERERHCFGKLGGSKIPQVINSNSFICG